MGRSGRPAWCALEVLAAVPARGRRTVDGAELGAWGRPRLGVAPNTAQRAVAALREGGLVTAIQDREARRPVRRDRLPVDGRRERSRAARRVTPLIASRPDGCPSALFPRRSRSSLVGEQLVLLPSV